MKHILCYGDSLTWGYDANTMDRFPFEKRWTGILQQKLGAKYRIIEEGLNGRTTVYNDEFTPFKEHGCGVDTLPMILDTHRPLDLVILMLGTNDFQPHRQAGPKEAARGAGRCIEQIQKSLSGPGGAQPKIILVSPPRLKKPTEFMECIFDESHLDSEAINCFFNLTAKTYNVIYLNASEKIQAADKDGIHLDEENNMALAQLLSEAVTRCLNGE